MKKIICIIFEKLIILGLLIIICVNIIGIKRDINNNVDKHINEDSVIINNENIINNKYAVYPYTVSDKGKEFIKSHEKLSLTAYNDPTPKKRSIGWGHQIQNGENYKVITKEKADELFESDIKKIEASVNRLLSKTNPEFKYTQGFIDGLASLVYNCGEYGVSTTEFYKRLLKCRIDNSENNINENDLNFTLAAVKTSKVFCKGHKIRRQKEYDLMIN